MTSKQPTGISDRILIAGAVCFGFVDAFVLSNAWLTHGSWNLFMLGLPLAQCVLVAAWAATSKANLGLRFGLPLLTMLVSWKIVQHISGLPFESTLMAQWMTALTWVVGVVVVGARANWIREESQETGEFWKNYVRVDLKTMMMMTLAAGIAFAFVQYGRVHWQWSVNGLRSREPLILNLLGFLTGIQGLSCLGFLRSVHPRNRLYRGGLHLAVLVACSFLFGFFDTPGDWTPSVRVTLTLWLSSSAVIIFSVVVGRGLSAKLAPASQSEMEAKSL